MKKISLMLMVLSGLFFLCACEEDETTDGTGNSVNLKRDLACYITFDNGDASDNTGHGFNGVLSHGTQIIDDTPNGKGKALSIDGTSQQFVNIPYSIIGDSTNYSLSIWIKDFGTGALISGISQYKYVPSLFITSDCKFGFDVSDRTYSFNQEISYLQTRMWHHVVLTATRSLGMVYLYVDGSLFDSSEIYGITSEQSKMQIGGNGEGHFNAWADPMLVDNFRVYRRCISEKEVKELYKEESN